MSKQSNKQTQNVNVVVNNKVGCCEKPKRKRKSRPKQEEPPMDDGGFPVLDTPAQTRPSYSALPVRNTVYMPSTVQISPEGMMPPIPSYFEKPMTNLMRTMEDFQHNMMKEWQEYQQAANPTIAPSTTDFADLNIDGFGSPTETPKFVETQSTPMLLQEEPEPPLISSSLTTPSPSITYEYAPSPDMNRFLLNRDLFEDPVQASTLATQTPLPKPKKLTMQDQTIANIQPRQRNLTMQDQTIADIQPQSKLDKLIVKLPDYLRQFNEAKTKADKGKAFEKIKKVGKELGLIETRGRTRTMEDYIARVQAQLQRQE